MTCLFTVGYYAVIVYICTKVKLTYFTELSLSELVDLLLALIHLFGIGGAGGGGCCTTAEGCSTNASVAHALQVQEMNSKRCFTCNRPGHLARDYQEWEEKNGIRPLQPKGPPLNKSVPEKAKQKPSQPSQPGPPTE